MKPLSFVQFIMEAIEEVAPNLGEEVYWRAFDRYEKYAADRRKQRQRKKDSDDNL